MLATTCAWVSDCTLLLSWSRMRLAAKFLAWSISCCLMISVAAVAAAFCAALTAASAAMAAPLRPEASVATV